MSRLEAIHFQGNLRNHLHRSFDTLGVGRQPRQGNLKWILKKPLKLFIKVVHCRCGLTTKLVDVYQFPPIFGFKINIRDFKRMRQRFFPVSCSNNRLNSEADELWRFGGNQSMNQIIGQKGKCVSRKRGAYNFLLFH